MPNPLKATKSIIRVAGKLREIVTVKDEKGNILHKVMRPLMLEFYPRDVVQVIIGAAILAIPLGFTEEVWNLGANLPIFNVILLAIISLTFISVFVYYNYYKGSFKKHWDEFLKRVLSTYLISFLVVGLFLTIIERAPWQLDLILAIKRTILVAFPASLSAAIADIIK